MTVSNQPTQVSVNQPPLSAATTPAAPEPRNLEPHRGGGFFSQEQALSADFLTCACKTKSRLWTKFWLLLELYSPFYTGRAVQWGMLSHPIG